MTSPQTAKQHKCPSCGEPYLLGDDVCENCQFELSSLGMPDTESRDTESDFGGELTEVRMSAPHSLSPRALVAEAVEILRGDPSGAVMVVERGALVGIFTERDVLRKVADRADMLERPLEEVMTPDPVILRDSDTIATALNKIAVGGFRHIPLVHGDQLVGVVTASDLMQWFMQKYID